jgi:hypothetical protein
MNNSFYAYLICLKKLGYHPYLDIRRLLFKFLSPVWNGHLRLNYKSKALRRFGFTEPYTITIPPYSLKCIWDRKRAPRPDKCFPNGKLYLILDKQLPNRILDFEESFRQKGIAVESCIFELPVEGLEKPLQILALGWKPGLLTEKFFSWKGGEWSCRDPLFSWQEDNPWTKENPLATGTVISSQTILDFKGLCRVDTADFWYYQSAMREECGVEFEKLSGKAYDWKLTGEVKLDPLHPPDLAIDPLVKKKTQIRAFIKSFPFGCSSFRRGGEDLRYGKFTNAWCQGVGWNESLVNMALKDLLDDEAFSVILKHYGIIMTKYLFPVFNRVVDSKWPREDRLVAIKNVLAQKYEKFSADCEGPNLYPYMYLRKSPISSYVHPDLRAVWVPEGLSFSKPHWNRENHRLVAFKGFTEICRCVLGMQKFRQAEFPLLESVVDRILENVFELQLRDFEAKLILRKTKFDQLIKLYTSGPVGREAVAKTCLNAGVLAFDWYQPFRENIDRYLWFTVDDMLGIPISHQTLRRNWTAFTEEICEIVYISPHYSNAHVIGERIVDYCREHDIDLWMVLKYGDKGETKFRACSSGYGIALL